jgi:ABC-type lipoprotein export system ATPase subunit
MELVSVIQPEPSVVVDAVLSLREVTKTFGTPGQTIVTAVRDVSLDVARGEFCVLTGRSGSGKTTLLNLASGLLRPTKGQVYLLGEDLWQMSDRAQSTMRNEQIGFIFQFPSLLPSLTVLQNVLLPSTFGRSNHERDAGARARELIDSVGLTEKLGSLPRQLSKGQQQRVVVARALMNEPRLLIADEPTSDLDEETEHEIMGLLSRVHVDTGVTVLLVTHATELTSYGTRAIRMADGEIAY